MSRTIVYDTELEQQHQTAVGLSRSNPDAASQILTGLVESCANYYPEPHQADTLTAHSARITRDMGAAGIRMALYAARHTPNTAPEALFYISEGLDMSLRLVDASGRSLEGLLPKYRCTNAEDAAHLSGEAGASESMLGRGWLAKALSVLPHGSLEQRAALAEAGVRFHRAALLHGRGDNAYYAASNRMHIARLHRINGEPIRGTVAEAVREVRRYPNSRMAAVRTIVRVGLSLATPGVAMQSIRRGNI